MDFRDIIKPVFEDELTVRVLINFSPFSGPYELGYLPKRDEGRLPDGEGGEREPAGAGQEG